MTRRVVLAGAAALGLAGCAATVKQRFDPLVGKATYKDIEKTYGKPAYDHRDAVSGERLVQWVHQGPFGIGRWLADYRHTLTVWFDRSDVLQRWEWTKSD
jgi:hypothetical protein